MTKRIALAVVFTALGDICLFDHALGAGVTVFALGVAALAGWAYRARLLHAGPWLLFWLLLVLAAAYQPSGMCVALIVAVGWAILARVRAAELPPFAALIRGASGGLRGYVAAPSDLRRSVLIGRRRVGREGTPWWVYVVAASITLFFALLILPANLVLSRSTERVFEFLELLEFDRAFFWLLIFGGVYGVLRFRLGRRVHARARPASAGEAVSRGNEMRLCLLTFGALNGLFLVANFTDALFLWVRFELPEGLTYSAYAHQGAYRLMLAVVLAAATVEIFFRRGTEQAADKRARGLAYLFVLQNLLVLAGAARRLALYAEAYGLSRFRVAAIFWLVLVAIGFVLIAVRLRRNRHIRFLLDTNTVSAVIVLALWSILNVDGFIANFNVDRFLSGTKDQVDVEYLEHLLPASLPALARLAEEGEGEDERAEQARATARHGIEEARATNALWASWSLQRASAIDEAEAILKEP